MWLLDRLDVGKSIKTDLIEGSLREDSRIFGINDPNMEMRLKTVPLIQYGSFIHEFGIIFSGYKMLLVSIFNFFLITE